MEERYNIVVNQVCDQLKGDINTLGIILYGSLVEELQHEHSDIDLIVVSKKDVDIVKCIEINGIYVQMLIRSFERFKEKLNKHTRSKPYSLYAKVLYDREGNIEELLEASKKEALLLGPLPLSENEKYMKHISLSDDIIVLGLVKQNNYEGATLLLNELLLNAVELYYDYNKWYIVTSKRLINDLKNRDPYLGELASVVILSDDIKAKLANYHLLKNHILSLVGGEINEYEIDFLKT